ncbi:MAG: YoaK family protein [Acidimicrobiales bacterium]
MGSRQAMALAVALTLATGATDVISYTRLGGAFSSVMTGNLVLLGLSAGRRDAALATNVALAIGGYVAGALAGSRIAGVPAEGRPTWPARVSVTLGAELAVLGGLLAGWTASGPKPAGGAQLGLLAGAATAMGMQSAAVRAVGIAGLSTTYLTGTLTGVLASLVSAKGIPWHSIALLLALVLGAAGGGLLVVGAAGFAPVLPVVVLAAVLVASVVMLAGAPVQERTG